MSRKQIAVAVTALAGHLTTSPVVQAIAAEARFDQCYICAYRGPVMLPVHILRPSSIHEAKSAAEKACRTAARTMKHDPSSCVYSSCTLSKCPHVGGRRFLSYKAVAQELPICSRYGFDC